MSRLPILLLALVPFFFSDHTASAQLPTFILGYTNDTIVLPFPASKTFRRRTHNLVTFKPIEQVYRVCNGKNKKTCGFWENVKTKKKMPSGPTTYNAKNKTLIIKKFRETDGGIYSKPGQTENYEVFFIF